MSKSRNQKLTKQDKNFFNKLYRQRRTREETAKDTVAKWGGNPSRKKKVRKSNRQEG